MIQWAVHPVLRGLRPFSDPINIEGDDDKRYRYGQANGNFCSKKSANLERWPKEAKRIIVAYRDICSNSQMEFCRPRLMGTRSY